MKKSDAVVAIGVLAVVFLFLFNENAQTGFSWLNRNHAYIMSFFKFAILATFGEILALRITRGIYWQKEFGLLARMLVWGGLGIAIKIAFGIFASGTPHLLVSLGIVIKEESLTSGNWTTKLLTAFSISCAMNCIFAPLMMTFHKITDTHIIENKGSILSLTSLNCSAILKKIDWDIMCNFVFKKTIPFFWIPAHTITFLLPPEFQILFAAFLGIMLGLILAVAGKKNRA